LERPAKNLLVTGRPGIGKTTCVMRTVDILRARGVDAGGMVTLEVRREGARIGFKIVDLATGEEAWLARVGAPGRIRVGRYTVLLENLEEVGVGAIRRAIEGADVVVIDEIGPMELKSRKFREAAWEALESPKPVLATIHVAASRHPFGRQVYTRGDVEAYGLNYRNRGEMPRVLAGRIFTLLGLA